MKVREHLMTYHQVLAQVRWPQELYDADQSFWIGKRKAEKSAAIFEAHMRRCQGQGSPGECDTVAEAATRRR